MTDSARPPRIVLWMAVFVGTGAPFVYLIWDFINEVLSGRFHLGTAGLAVLGVAGVIGILKLVARRAAVWEGQPTPAKGDPA